MDIKANPHPFYEGVFVTEDGRVFQECRAVLSSGGYHLVSVLPTSSTKRVRVRRHTLILKLSMVLVMAELQDIKMATLEMTIKTIWNGELRQRTAKTR